MSIRHFDEIEYVLKFSNDVNGRQSWQPTLLRNVVLLLYTDHLYLIYKPIYQTSCTQNRFFKNWKLESNSTHPCISANLGVSPNSFVNGSSWVIVIPTAAFSFVAVLFFFTRS